MKSLSYLRKLRKMSIREIRVRLQDVMRLRIERQLWRQPPVVDRDAMASGNTILSHAERTLPGTSYAELRQLAASVFVLHNELASQAEANSQSILAKSWPMLGHDFDLKGEINWHADPRTDHVFPNSFYADVPTHQACDDEVDVKYVWELGRHQYLVELSRGWLFTQDKHCAEHARRLLLSWIDENPQYEGVHWTSGLEVAVRGISWIWTLAGLADWDGWDDGNLSRVHSSLIEHATYLEHHFSYYSSPYNHLIGEATGLFLIAKVVKDHPRSEYWRNLAQEVLEEHGPKQFYSDGFCVEQATDYHYFTCGFLAMAVVSTRQEGTELPNVERTLHKALKTGMLFRQPDGRWPAIGDVDSARSIPVHHNDFWDFSGLSNLGAVLFDDPELKCADTKPGAELYWLLGTDGLEQWHRLESRSPQGIMHLEESGYVIGRRDNNWFCFDAGPVAHGLHSDSTPSTAHGHLDTLQVIYVHDGQPVLIDPGMPFYFQNRQWVRHFRSPAAHNTLEIEGIAFAKDVGRLEWSHVLQKTELDLETSDHEWEARGTVTIPTPVTSVGSKETTVERAIQFGSNGGLTIIDRVQTDQPRAMNWYWQFPTKCHLEPATESSLMASLVNGQLFLTFESNHPGLRVDFVTDDGPTTKQAEGYGNWGQRHSICVSAPPVSQVQVTTAISTVGRPPHPQSRRSGCLSKVATGN